MHLNRHFLEKDIQMTNKHIKRCSTLLAIREMQIKTTMRCYFTPTRLAIIKMKNVREDMEKLEHCSIAGGNVK